MKHSVKIDLPEWVDLILDGIGVTDGVDDVLCRLKGDDFLIIIKYGKETFEFIAGTDGEWHGVQNDGGIHDMTSIDQVQRWIAGELYTMLQRMKQILEGETCPHCHRPLDEL